jgi:transmembrane sensor
MMDQLTDEEKFLLLGKVTGSLSEQEELALEKLFAEKPAARTAYEELENELPVANPQAFFAARREIPAWNALHLKMHQQPATSVRRMPSFKRTWVAAAIVIGVLIGAGLLWWNPFRTRESSALPTIAQKPHIELKLANGKVIDLSHQQGAIDAGAVQLTNTNKALTYSPGNDQPAGNNTLMVPVGMDYKIQLADGTEVWLNSATKLAFPFSFHGGTREISIDGEAYLKVSKDASRPFIVHLPKSSVQVIGTEFNVNTYDQAVEKVALVEGAVNVKTPAGESRLYPGNQAVYSAGRLLQQEGFDTKYVLSWRKGLFYFNDASLAEISKVVPRWYGVNMAIDDPTIHSRRFTGVINRNRPIAVFLDDLKAIASIDSWFDKDSTLHLK